MDEPESAVYAEESHAALGVTGQPLCIAKCFDLHYSQAGGHAVSKLVCQANSMLMSSWFNGDSEKDIAVFPKLH